MFTKFLLDFIWIFLKGISVISCLYYYLQNAFNNILLTFIEIENVEKIEEKFNIK